MNALLKNDLILIGLAGLALLIFVNNSRAITAGAIGGAADAVTGTIQGIGDAVNDSIINPAVQTVTGDRNATLGGWLWELLHPQAADELRYGVNLDGSVNYPPGALIHY